MPLYCSPSSTPHDLLIGQESLLCIYTQFLHVFIKFMFREKHLILIHLRCMREHSELKACVLSGPKLAVLCCCCKQRCKQVDPNLQNSTWTPESHTFQVILRRRHMRRSRWCAQVQHAMENIAAPGHFERSVSSRLLCQALPLGAPRVAVCLA